MATEEIETLYRELHDPYPCRGQIWRDNDERNNRYVRVLDVNRYDDGVWVVIVSVTNDPHWQPRKRAHTISTRAERFGLDDREGFTYICEA